jgi:hypothetical protein
MTVVTDGGGGGETLLGTSEGRKTFGRDHPTSEEEKTKILHADQRAKGSEMLQNNGVNRRKTLPVDAIQAGIQRRTLSPAATFRGGRRS